MSESFYSAYSSPKQLKVKFHEKALKQFLNFEFYYSLQSYQQFFTLFLSPSFEYIVIENDNDENKPDICIYDIHLDDNSTLSNDSINIMVSIENCKKWTWYEHYNKYGEYNDEKIDIYFYNHITNIIRNDKYISIPAIHLFINYFIQHYNQIIPSEITPFQDKKFCLIINKSNLNPEIGRLYSILKNIDNIDHIQMYNDLIETKSCYNSVELLNVFNKYKFIICFENSYENGYITEKIFNCFFARTIPIYKGSPIIHEYINEKSFINMSSTQNAEQFNHIIQTIKDLSCNEQLYNSCIHMNKMNENYNNENYKTQLSEFIKNKLLEKNNRF